MSPRTLYTFVTGNPNKLKEVQQILGESINLTNKMPEIQGSPQEIAIAKCKAALNEINAPVITEDTCLCFDSLNGLPGPYIKHFLQSLGHQGLNKMLAGFQSDQYPDNGKGAYAMTICALGIPGQDVILFEGITKGKIVQARGSKDFGWDPIFVIQNVDPDYYHRNHMRVSCIQKATDLYFKLTIDMISKSPTVLYLGNINQSIIYALTQYQQSKLGRKITLIDTGLTEKDRVGFCNPGVAQQIRRDIDTPQSLDTRKHVLIVGAGPAGCFSAIKFIQLGWRVTLADKYDNQNLSLSANLRKSWFVGFSAIGQSALKSVEGLYEHISQIAIRPEGFSMVAYGRKIKLNFESMNLDRNELTYRLFEFLTDMPKDPDQLITLYRHKLVYVDGDKNIAHFETGPGLKSLGYDLLVGADGANSMLRNTLFSQDKNFSIQQSGIFQHLKSIFIEAPKATFFLNPFKGGGVVMLIPNMKGQLNFLTTVFDHQVLEDELLSDDPKVVQQFFAKISKYLEFDIKAWEDFVKAKWYQTQQVITMPYVLDQSRGSAVLIGDAAHATSPALGLGMNTGLQDGQVLFECLEKYENIDVALEQYSNLRIKAGHALTEMSSNLFAINSGLAIRSEIKQMLRDFLSKITFGYIEKSTREQITRFTDLTKIFSQVYSKGELLGIYRDNFETIRLTRWRNIGLLPHTSDSKKAHDQRLKMQGKQMFALTIGK